MNPAMLRILVGLALVWAAAVSTANALPGSTPPVVCPTCTPVFYGGLNGSACYRIPSIIRTHTGALLAFAENRKDNCGDNGKQHDLVMRRSLDGGRSWGAMQVIMAGKVPCPGCPAAISNPNPVEVKLPNGTMAILFHYDTMNNPNPSHHGLDMQVWSLDDGMTWGTNPTVLSYPPQTNTGALIGPSVGIQAANGRIYFSAVFGDYHFLYWSTDYGKTWAASEKLMHLGECSIAFYVSPDDGRILMNCRVSAGLRHQVIFSAEGVPLSNATTVPGLIDPGCQGSLVNNGQGSLLFSNCNTTTSRSHMTVKSSPAGDGKQWSNGVNVWEGPSGYSQLVPLGTSRDTVGLLFECGLHSTYETISFAIVKL